MLTLHIGRPIRTPRRVEVPLALDGEEIAPLWYEIAHNTPGRFRVLDGGFSLIALLPFAMAKGYDIVQEQPVSAAMLANLEEWQDAWLRLRPDLYSRVEVRARVARERPRLPRSKASVLAFSGGLDSSYSLAAHRNRMLGFRSRTLGLGVLVNGMDINLGESSAFAVALASATRITDSFQLPLCAVSTNWKDFTPDYEATFLAGLASVLHLFSGRFRSCVVSGEFRYGREPLGWGSTSSTNHLLGHPAFPLETTGIGLSRLDKAVSIASNATIAANLRVCFERPMTGRNCGECFKCVRTALIFLALGVERTEALGPASLEKLERLLPLDDAKARLFEDVLDYPGPLPEQYRSKLEAVVAGASRGSEAGPKSLFR